MVLSDSVRTVLGAGVVQVCQMLVVCLHLCSIAQGCVMCKSLFMVHNGLIGMLLCLCMITMAEVMQSNFGVLLSCIRVVLRFATGICGILSSESMGVGSVFAVTQGLVRRGMVESKILRSCVMVSVFGSIGQMPTRQRFGMLRGFAVVFCHFSVIRGMRSCVEVTGLRLVLIACVGMVLGGLAVIACGCKAFRRVLVVSLGVCVLFSCLVLMTFFAIGLGGVCASASGLGVGLRCLRVVVCGSLLCGVGVVAFRGVLVQVGGGQGVKVGAKALAERWFSGWLGAGLC